MVLIVVEPSQYLWRCRFLVVQDISRYLRYSDIETMLKR
jgi:hypothetical protein